MILSPKVILRRGLASIDLNPSVCGPNLELLSFSPSVDASRDPAIVPQLGHHRVGTRGPLARTRAGGRARPRPEAEDGPPRAARGRRWPTGAAPPRRPLPGPGEGLFAHAPRRAHARAVPGTAGRPRPGGSSAGVARVRVGVWRPRRGAGPRPGCRPERAGRQGVGPPAAAASQMIPGHSALRTRHCDMLCLKRTGAREEYRGQDRTGGGPVGSKATPPAISDTDPRKNVCRWLVPGGPTSVGPPKPSLPRTIFP
jgi:hypothetical protein